MALASKIRIEIDGEELRDFLHLTINQSIYAFHEFSIVCRMDTFEKEGTCILEQTKKIIGSIITILIESESSGGQNLLFKGIICSVGASKSDTGEADHITLSGQSPDILLNDNWGCRSFENKTLKQIIDELLRPYPQDVVKSKCNPEKKDQLPYVVQYNETRYDFIRRLAARFGEWFLYDGTKLLFGQLPTNKVDVILGVDMSDFNFSIKTNSPKFKYVSYNYESAETLETSSSKSGGKKSLNEYGAYAHDKSTKQYTQESTLYYDRLNAPGSNMKKELDNVVELQENATALSMNTVQGSSENAQLTPGSKIKIKALKSDGGEIDYGEYIVTSVTHSSDSTMNYQNSFEAIPAEAKVPDYSTPLAIPYCETQTAVVMDNNDPDKLGRIRVKFHWQENNVMSPWLRIANTYSGNNNGFYFIPEVGDEVIVGFEGGNAEKPFVIGSLYHGKNKPLNEWPNQNNNFKGILTRSKLKIEFDEEKKITSIETPAGNQVILSDNDKSILLEDQNQNKVELNSGGIVLDSPKDIKITSKSKVTIEGTGGIDISSTADAKISGLNVNLDANAAIAAKGKAGAEISSVGNTTIKGAMVMIN
jgi:Rhs element Vgr protein